MVGIRRVALLTAGLASMLAGACLLAWLASPFLDFGDASPATSARLEQQLHARWQAGSPPTSTEQKTPREGLPFAIIRIPRLGQTWSQPVIQGVGDPMLAEGVGHYPTTQLPGQVGNFAVAGHRITHGSPFSGLLNLRTGDEVIVETQAATYVYVIDHPPAALTVNSAASWVLDPVPGRPLVRANSAIITLTTCTDLFHSPWRSVGFGHLTETIRTARTDPGDGTAAAMTRGGGARR